VDNLTYPYVAAESVLRNGGIKYKLLTLSVTETDVMFSTYIQWSEEMNAGCEETYRTLSDLYEKYLISTSLSP